jgi:hypothetical protein
MSIKKPTPPCAHNDATSLNVISWSTPDSTFHNDATSLNAGIGHTIIFWWRFVFRLTRRVAEATSKTQSAFSDLDGSISTIWPIPRIINRGYLRPFVFHTISFLPLCTLLRSTRRAWNHGLHSTVILRAMSNKQRNRISQSKAPTWSAKCQIFVPNNMSIIKLGYLRDQGLSTKQVTWCIQVRAPSWSNTLHVVWVLLYVCYLEYKQSGQTYYKE